MASFRAWAAAGPYEGVLDSHMVGDKGRDLIRDAAVWDRNFLDQSSLAPRLALTRSLRNLEEDPLWREQHDGSLWRRSSVYDPVWRRSAWERPFNPLDPALLSPRVLSPRRETSTTVTNSRGDVVDTRTVRDVYGDQITTRRVSDQYSVKTSVVRDPCAGDRVVNPARVSPMRSPAHRDDFLLDQLRTKTYMDRLDGTDTRSLYLDDPLHSRSSRYLDDPVWRRSRYLDDSLWSSPSRLLKDDLWRRTSTNKSSAVDDRAWRRAMRALI